VLASRSFSAGWGIGWLLFLPCGRPRWIRRLARGLPLRWQGKRACAGLDIKPTLVTKISYNTYCMLVFIDNSGDPGFKIAKGSSEIFVISLVIFDDDLEAEKTALAIKEIRRKLQFPDDMEFKFFKSQRRVRAAFLNAVVKNNFRIRSLIIRKSLIYSPELRTNKKSFYAYAIKMALRYSGNTIMGAKIKIDGSGDRTFRQEFLSYLRRELNSKDRTIVASCKLVDSRSNGLIQLADMVAGSIRRSYDVSKTDAAVYKRILSHRIEDEWQFQ
jgi:hypothetical protein